jgi:asparagine synthase (glutamine-hydrolysing)
MSGICGYVGQPSPEALTQLINANPWRGDATDTWKGEGVALGYRWWRGRPGKSPAIYAALSGARLACAGTLAPFVDNPAALVAGCLEGQDFSTLDGAFAAAQWSPQTKTLTLLRDPFGVRSLYYVQHNKVFYFATELKQLLAVLSIPVELDLIAVHKYLTFSFVPGEDTPIKGIRRLLPGHLLRFCDGRLSITPYFELKEIADPALEDQAEAARFVRREGRKAVRRRLNGEAEVGLFLSGGLDSSAVGVWLKDVGAKMRAFTLDFGEASVEKEQAALVAKTLELPLQSVPMNGSELLPLLEDLVHRLDLPFGDAVTGPHYVLNKAAKEAGLTAIFNGEGGDQLFGGWTSKPMVAAAIYGGVVDDDSPEEQYLRSYHRFYGLEEQLYSPALRAQITPGQRRALLQPYLHSETVQGFLNRVRLTDISLKGSQNILPRAERLSNAWGIDMRVPLFDRALAEASFRIPPSLKLRGACEKYVLKLALQNKLPEEIVWRRKFGMSVPITDWLLGKKGGTKPGPLFTFLQDTLSDQAINRRGLLQSSFVSKLRSGQDEPAETRRRRLGEKLWALLMLELWLTIFIDRRGQR